MDTSDSLQDLKAKSGTFSQSIISFYVSEINYSFNTMAWITWCGFLLHLLSKANIGLQLAETFGVHSGPIFKGSGRMQPGKL